MKTLRLILIFMILISCKNEEKEKTKDSRKAVVQEVTKDSYEVSKPDENIKAVLVLFGGYPENIADIKREFNILEIAKANKVAVVFMNYNQKLWLEENEKRELAEQLQKIFRDNALPYDSVFFGGFSSGGTIALSISDFVNQQNKEISSRGVFAIDSPVDLVALYRSAEKNIERNFSKAAVQESTWLLEQLGERLGNPHSDISKYLKYSIYVSERNSSNKLKNLKNTKIRFYTEPDTLWWKENRMAAYDQMNAYYLKRLSEKLKKSGFNQVEYIPTTNKGYRASGERHPHSWAIVDVKELIKWILE